MVKTAGTVACKMIGYKILTTDLCSMSSQYGSVQYGTDWVDVPGHGAYIGLTLPGLLRGHFREPAVLAECEYEDATGIANDGHVVTARRVRVLRHAPVDRWHLVRAAISAAKIPTSEGFFRDFRFGRAGRNNQLLNELLFDFLESVGLVATLAAWTAFTVFMLASPYWTANGLGLVMLAVTLAVCIPLFKGLREALRAFVSWRRSRRKTGRRRTTWFRD